MAELLDDPVNPLLKPHAQNPPFVQLVPRCQLSAQLKSFWSSLARMCSDIAVTRPRCSGRPAYVVLMAANEFPTKTVRPNEMWQTGFYQLQNHWLGMPWLARCSTCGVCATCPLCWTTSHVTSSLGSCAARCGHRTLPTRWIWLCRHQAATAHRSSANRACYRTMAPIKSRVNRPNISKRKR